MSLKKQTKKQKKSKEIQGHFKSGMKIPSFLQNVL